MNTAKVRLRLVISDSQTNFRQSADVLHGKNNTEKDVDPGNLLTTVEDLACWDENFYRAQVGAQPIKQMYECGA
jgi:hypothetical protein